MRRWKNELGMHSETWEDAPKCSVMGQGRKPLQKEKPRVAVVEEDEDFNGVPRLGNWDVTGGLLP